MPSEPRPVLAPVRSRRASRRAGALATALAVGLPSVAGPAAASVFDEEILAASATAETGQVVEPVVSAPAPEAVASQETGAIVEPIAPPAAPVVVPPPPPVVAQAPPPVAEPPRVEPPPAVVTPPPPPTPAPEAVASIETGQIVEPAVPQGHAKVQAAADFVPTVGAAIPRPAPVPTPSEVNQERAAQATAQTGQVVEPITVAVAPPPPPVVEPTPTVEPDPIVASPAAVPTPGPEPVPTPVPSARVIEPAAQASLDTGQVVEPVFSEPTPTPEVPSPIVTPTPTPGQAGTPSDATLDTGQIVEPVDDGLDTVLPNHPKDAADASSDTGQIVEPVAKGLEGDLPSPAAKASIDTGQIVEPVTEGLDTVLPNHPKHAAKASIDTGQIVEPVTEGLDTVLPNHPKDAADASAETGQVVEPIDVTPEPERVFPLANGHGIVEPVLIDIAPGDTLWGIASRTLGPEATDAEIAEYVEATWGENSERIGTGDPDLIHPGQAILDPEIAAAAARWDGTIDRTVRPPEPTQEALAAAETGQIVEPVAAGLDSVLPNHPSKFAEASRESGQIVEPAHKGLDTSLANQLEMFAQALEEGGAVIEPVDHGLDYGKPRSADAAIGDALLLSELLPAVVSTNGSVLEPITLWGTASTSDLSRIGEVFLGNTQMPEGAQLVGTAEFTARRHEALGPDGERVVALFVAFEVGISTPVKKGGEPDDDGNRSSPILQGSVDGKVVATFFVSGLTLDEAEAVGSRTGAFIKEAIDSGGESLPPGATLSVASNVGSDVTFRATRPKRSGPALPGIIGEVVGGSAYAGPYAGFSVLDAARQVVEVTHNEDGTVTVGVKAGDLDVDEIRFGGVAAVESKSGNYGASISAGIEPGFINQEVGGIEFVVDPEDPLGAAAIDAALAGGEVVLPLDTVVTEIEEHKRFGKLNIGGNIGGTFAGVPGKLEGFLQGRGTYFIIRTEREVHPTEGVLGQTTTVVGDYVDGAQLTATQNEDPQTGEILDQEIVVTLGGGTPTEDFNGAETFAYMVGGDTAQIRECGLGCTIEVDLSDPAIRQEVTQQISIDGTIITVGEIGDLRSPDSATNVVFIGEQPQLFIGQQLRGERAPSDAFLNSVTVVSADGTREPLARGERPFFGISPPLCDRVDQGEACISPGSESGPYEYPTPEPEKVEPFLPPEPTLEPEPTVPIGAPAVPNPAVPPPTPVADAPVSITLTPEPVPTVDAEPVPIAEPTPE